MLGAQVTRGALLRKRRWKKAGQRVVRFVFGNLLLIRLGVNSESVEIFSGTINGSARASDIWCILAECRSDV